MARELAIDTDGNLSWCTVPIEARGTRGCNHMGHKKDGESINNFIQRAEIVTQSIK